MNIKQIIGFIILILFLLVLVFIIQSYILGGIISKLKPNKNSAVQEPILVNKENLAWFLSRLSLIHDLHEDAVISLKFYNFNSGVRQWEESYVIKKGNAAVGEAVNPDLQIIMHSKYIPELGYGFCQTIKKARSNGDFAYKELINHATLLWKYKSMVKYKDCFVI